MNGENAAAQEGSLAGQDERISRMGTEPMVRLILKYSLPSIAGLLVTAFYSLADGIFIGIGVGDAGVAATTVALPFTTIVMALNTLIGNGGNIVASIRLGQGRQHDAEKSLGNTIMLMVITWVILMAIFFPTLHQVATVSGATAESIELAKQYMGIMTFGFIFGGLSGGIGNYMRTAGAPTMNMWFMIIAGLANILFDYLAVIVFGWGVSGAAWATVLSQFIAATMTMVFFTRKNTAIRFYLRNMKLEGGMVKEIFKLGLAGFFMNALMAITSIIINQLLLHYGNLEVFGGTGALAAYGASGRVMQIFFQIIIGITMAAQPIIGYNYGAGKLKRVKSCFWVSANMGFVGLLASTILAELIPSQMISLFGLTPDTLDYGIWLLRSLMIMLPLAAYGIVASTYFMATGQAGKANFLVLLRQIFLLVPFLFLCPIVLPDMFGITAAQAIPFAFPIVDVISTAVSMAFAFKDLKKLDRAIESGEKVEALEGA